MSDLVFSPRRSIWKGSHGMYNVFEVPGTKERVLLDTRYWVTGPELPPSDRLSGPYRDADTARLVADCLARGYDTAVGTMVEAAGYNPTNPRV